MDFFLSLFRTSPAPRRGFDLATKVRDVFVFSELFQTETGCHEEGEDAAWEDTTTDLAASWA